MDDSGSDTAEKTIIQRNHETMLEQLENRVNDCENQLKDYEKSLISIANIKMRNNMNSTDSAPVAVPVIEDDDEVQIFDLFELLKDIKDGGNILQQQNETLESAQRNLQHQMDILDKMVKLLKLEKGLVRDDDGDTKENIPPTLQSISSNTKK